MLDPGRQSRSAVQRGPAWAPARAVRACGGAGVPVTLACVTGGLLGGEAQGWKGIGGEAGGSRMRRRGGAAATSPCVRRFVGHASLHAPPPPCTHTYKWSPACACQCCRCWCMGGELGAGTLTHPTHAGGEEVAGGGSEVNWRHALAAPLCVCASHPHPPCWAAPRTRTHAHTGAAPTSRCAWQGRGEGGVGLPGGKPDFGGT